MLREEEEYEPLLYLRIVARGTPVGGHLHIRKLRKFELKHAAFETQTTKVAVQYEGYHPLILQSPNREQRTLLKCMARMIGEEALGWISDQGG